MLAKLTAVVFSFPSSTILLTNSASSLAVLGTLNGIATSVSAIGRGVGPAVVGWAFSIGVKAGYMIIPWWVLAVTSIMGAIPIFWIIETDGFQGNAVQVDSDAEEEEDRDQDQDQDEQEGSSNENGNAPYGSMTSANGSPAVPKAAPAVNAQTEASTATSSPESANSAHSK